MALLDKLTGTRYPDSATAPLPTTELRAALFALNGPGVPFVVRHGTSKERADLVAESRIPELRMTIRTRMKLDPAKREVRTFDERWEASSPEGGRRYTRGQVTGVYRQWTYERGPDGRRRRVETLSFDTKHVKDPLRNTVLAAGWTWRGVFFRL
ncbi:hypothetical protein ACHBTE_19325 [Streptomyces sp. M41]|uniref:hypothetical protein n=1 Tax=Streptomyces sp. M41 TaxID=3059412 RepID=UPI00374D3D39